MSLESIAPELAAHFADLLESVNATRAEVALLRSIMEAKPLSPPQPRRFYSVEEAARLLSKSAYSVREWCRLGRVNAVKREERRGGAALWSISSDELARIRDEGLLPLDPSRNLR